MYESTCIAMSCYQQSLLALGSCQGAFPADDFGEMVGLDGLVVPPCINMTLETVDAPEDTGQFEWAVWFASFVRARLFSKK